MKTDLPRPLIVEQRGTALVMTIDRPERRNAVNRAVSLALADALARLDADDALRVGILTGSGGSFSAGMDLKAFVDGERPELEGRGFGGFTEAPPAKPLIAAVEGFALAGGFEMALACDLIVASEDAVFGLPEVRLGLVAGSGGLVRLPRRMPEAIALEYALTGARMDAATAHRHGLVNRLVEPGRTLQAALVLAEEIAVGAPQAIAASKHILLASRDWPAEGLWDRQRSLAEPVIRSADALEGATAFAEKRAPRWSGR